MTDLMVHYRCYKRFCKQLDLGEWVIDKSDSSSYNINGENTVHYIINSRTGQKLWISNGFIFFSDYNYDRGYDLESINIFGLFKFFAWVKATPIIIKARIHNIKIIKLKLNEKRNAEKVILNSIANDD